MPQHRFNWVCAGFENLPDTETGFGDLFWLSAFTPLALEKSDGWKMIKSRCTVEAVIFEPLLQRHAARHHDQYSIDTRMLFIKESAVHDDLTNSETVNPTQEEKVAGHIVELDMFDF
jgi:hypothetical protein